MTNREDHLDTPQRERLEASQLSARGDYYITDKQRETVAIMIEMRGHVSLAARALDITPATLSMRFAHLCDRFGFTPVKNSGSQAEAARARELVARQMETRIESFIARSAASVSMALVPVRELSLEVAAMPIEPARLRPAICHDEREEYMLRRCRQCYAERVERSRASGEMIDRERAERRDRLLQESYGRIADEPETVGLPLTDTQLRVMKVEARGMTGKETASELGISEQTVKNHLTGAYTRLGARNLQQALVILGWTVIPDDDPDSATAKARDYELARRAVDEAIIALARAAESLEGA